MADKRLLKVSRLDKIKDWFAIRILKATRVKYGPIMSEIRGEWYFIDHIGCIWKITYTGDIRNVPFQMQLLYRP